MFVLVPVQFVGIMIMLLDSMHGTDPDMSAGCHNEKDETAEMNHSSDRKFIEVMVVLVNLAVFVWPLLRSFATGRMHDYFKVFGRSFLCAL